MAAKKTKKTVKSAKVSKAMKPASEPTVMENQTMPGIMQKSPKKLNSRFMTVLLVTIAIALLTYKFGPWLVPVVVEGKPITRFALWSRMETSYGAQTLDDMLNEQILDNAISKSGITIDQGKIDEQLTSLEKQFESVGGLEEALKQRGLTRAVLEKQVRTQLAIETILADKVSVSEEEISKEFNDNKDTLYQDKTIEETHDTIGSTLKESKLRDAFLAWYAEIKNQTQVKNFGL